MEITTTTNFPLLRALLAEVAEESVANPSVGTENVLRNVLRKKHYWPQLQVKSFFSNRGQMALLHNSYKRTDVKHFQALYDEFRSVVLNLGGAAAGGAGIEILAVSEGLPTQTTLSEYVAAPSDICRKTYEGTQIFVYNADGTWHFSTTGCPTVNSSRYSHPTKSHGQMLDEVLAAAQLTRETFALGLDPTQTYTFLMVHHENCKLIDHSTELGAGFKQLFHIGQRAIGTLEPYATMLSIVNGCQYEVAIKPEEMLAYMASAAAQTTHGFLVKRANGEMLKLQHDAVVEADSQNAGHHNTWQNMLTTYKQNDQKFKVNDYIAKYNIDLTGVPEQPTYIIHTAVCTMRDIVNSTYNATTQYDLASKRYAVMKEIDGPLPPIMRFHLAQLRFIQITSHHYAPLTDRAVYRYLCGLTMKNFRLLLTFLVNSPIMQQVAQKAGQCMYYLHSVLEAK